MRSKIIINLAIVAILITTLLVNCTRSPNASQETLPTAVITVPVLQIEPRIPNGIPTKAGTAIDIAPTETTRFQYDVVWSAPKGCILSQLSPNKVWVTYVCTRSNTEGGDQMWLQRVDSASPPTFLSNTMHSVWSPNSDALITYYFEPPKLITLPDLNQREILTGMRLLDPPQWAPNGEALLVGRVDNNSLLSVVYPDGTIKTLLTESDFLFPPTMLLNPIWLPDSQHIYWGWRSNWFSGQESINQIWEIDIKTGTRELILETTEDIRVGDIQIVDANTLRLGDFLFDTMSQQLTYSPLPFQVESAASYAWSPNGQLVAHWDERSGKELRLYTLDGNHTILINLTDGSESRRIVGWEDDGSGLWVILDEYGTETGHEKLAFISMPPQ